MENGGAMFAETRMAKTTLPPKGGFHMTSRMNAILDLLFDRRQNVKLIDIRGTNHFPKTKSNQ